MNLIFDIETDGLYNDVTRIHCIGVYDLDAKQTLVYNDVGSEEPITKGVQLLEDACTIIGHNIISYDIPVIKKLYPWFKPKGRAIDTLLLSRLYFADRLGEDNKLKHKGQIGHMPVQLLGRHSLEAYGHRLGEYKGDYGKTTDWKDWSQEMQDYCLQDVVVTRKLWRQFRQFLTG